MGEETTKLKFRKLSSCLIVLRILNKKIHLHAKLKHLTTPETTCRLYTCTCALYTKISSDTIFHELHQLWMRTYMLPNKKTEQQYSNLHATKTTKQSDK